jgi:ATP-dependent protease ClpP protease subunit
MSTITDISTARRKERGRYEIRNAAEKVAELWIYDEISAFWGVDAGEFNRDLAKITAPTIKLRLNSPGGDVHAGIAIYNALRRHPSRVVTYVDGIAASIASVVALAGDEVIMPSNTFMMIHNASAFAGGDARALREAADILEKHSETIRAIYVERTGKTEAEIQDLMDAETWMTAQEALDLGFADTVADEALAAAACADLTGFGFRHVPADLAARAEPAAAAAPLTDDGLRQMAADWGAHQARTRLLR